VDLQVKSISLYLQSFFDKNACSDKCQWLTTVILATQEAEIGRIPVGGQPGQIARSQLTRAKWAGGMAQEIVCLPCKCKILTAKKKKKLMFIHRFLLAC
jgi:hypothetical protein